MKRILHIDMDAFFASVEQAKRPELKGKPVIIGGSKGDRRGVVSTCSYEARAFGVHSAMPLQQAQKLCPNGICLPGNYHEYSAISKRIRTLLFEISPMVEMTSIDEGYIDITGSFGLFSNEEAMATHLKNRIQTETGLSCSIGIASNRLIAKVASDAYKPNGYSAIANGEEASFLAPMNVKKIPGIGPKMCESLNRSGIHLVKDLQALPIETLMRRFGNAGMSLHRKSLGKGSTSLQLSREAKSMSRETTFPEDITDWDTVESTLSYLMERCLYRLRESHMEGRTITLKIRNTDFRTYTYSQALSDSTSRDAVVWKTLKSLLKKAHHEVTTVRLVGFHIGKLSNAHQQLLLSEIDETKQWEKALQGVDALRERFGFDSIQSGKSMGIRKNTKRINSPPPK